MEGKVAHLFAGEFNRSDLVVPADDPRDRPALLTPTGLSLGRLTIAGALTEVEGKSGDFVHARIADPTGAFTLRSGWHRPEVSSALAAMEPPAFVAVTGSPLLPSRAPVPVLLPEAVAVVDRRARDTSVIATAELTIGRLEHLAAIFAGTQGEDPAIGRAIAHYRITPAFLLDLAAMVDQALSSVGVVKAPAAAAGRDPKELVLALLGARPKEAIPLEEILAELGRQGIAAETGTRAVNELLGEGECYMPRKGSVRLA
ncbi:MAG TPA: hypothetical protein VEI51_05380 [Methanomicrobiales archaeon]|nr:hypothetical protein [Methanomicrobiales archaeon]